MLRLLKPSFADECIVTVIALVRSLVKKRKVSRKRLDQDCILILSQKLLARTSNKVGIWRLVRIIMKSTVSRLLIRFALWRNRWTLQQLSSPTIGLNLLFWILICSQCQLRARLLIFTVTSRYRISIEPGNLSLKWVRRWEIVSRWLRLRVISWKKRPISRTDKCFQKPITSSLLWVVMMPLIFYPSLVKKYPPINSRALIRKRVLLSG